MSTELMALLFYIIIGISVVFYVVLDGFDLGVGALHIFAKDDKLARITPEVGKFFSGSKIAKVEIFIIDPSFCFFIIGVTILEARTTFRK